MKICPNVYVPSFAAYLPSINHRMKPLVYLISALAIGILALICYRYASCSSLKDRLWRSEDPIKENKNDEVHVQPEPKHVVEDKKDDQPAATVIPLATVIKNTPAIVDNFTTVETIEQQIAAHESAKLFLKKELGRVGAYIDFISHPFKTSPRLEDVSIDQKFLDAVVFMSQYTSGVNGDIELDGQRKEDNVVIYGAASQFNGCEAPAKFTVKPGEAVLVYENDHTQGPQAQLAFSPEQVELINCGGNLGFNALCKLLDEETKSQIAHGYFTPGQDKAPQVIQQLRTHGDAIEYPCIGSVPLNGEKMVYEILVSAPAFGGYANASSANGQERNEIQFLCALHGFRAQFQKSIDLAIENNKPVCFKPTAVGLGVFGNNPEIVAKAFYHAATEYQKHLKDNNVQVLFQIYKGDGGADPKAAKMANELGLKNTSNP